MSVCFYIIFVLFCVNRNLSRSCSVNVLHNFSYNYALASPTLFYSSHSNHAYTALHSLSHTFLLIQTHTHTNTHLSGSCIPCLQRLRGRGCHLLGWWRYPEPNKEINFPVTWTCCKAALKRRGGTSLPIIFLIRRDYGTTEKAIMLFVHFS